MVIGKCGSWHGRHECGGRDGEIRGDDRPLEASRFAFPASVSPMEKSGKPDESWTVALEDNHHRLES